MIYMQPPITKNARNGKAKDHLSIFKAFPSLFVNFRIWEINYEIKTKGADVRCWVAEFI